MSSWGTLGMLRKRDEEGIDPDVGNGEDMSKGILEEAASQHK